ncbi:MAG: hypothetical protein ACFB2Y_00975 [Fulvivirga sp.]
MGRKFELITQNIFQRLLTQISIIKEKIRAENSVNDQGINTLMEGTIIHVLNFVNGWELVNAIKATSCDQDFEFYFFSSR